MRKWKPTVVTFILVVASSFGVFTIFGAEVATGTVVSGHISVDTTWNLLGSPYVVIGNVIVDPGVTLTINPGVRVEFENRQFPPYLNMFVEGTLNATGSNSSMIEITKTDPGQPGWWGAIQINSTGHAYIRYCNMSYGDTSVSIGSSSKVNVTDNVFIDAWGMLQPLGPTTPGHRFANNTLTRSLLVLNSSNNTVVDNMLEYGMAIYNGDGNLVMRNVMPGNGGIYMEFSDNNWILNNLITDSPSRGFTVSNSNNNVFSDNIFRNITTHAIDLLSGNGNRISGNVVAGAEYCIYNSGDDGTIQNNTMKDCDTGILTYGNNDVIFGNSISDSRIGIRAVTNTKTKIIQNDIVNNSEYGIWLVMCDNVSVYHNNILDNVIQAWDDNTTGRFWDAGYPLGGNYWSDYSGVDVKSGANQDISGGDGIGDDPYLFNLTSRDRYPLAEMATPDIPPRNVWAKLTGKDFENVTITWNLSWNDGRRANDTIRYDVYRSRVYESDRAGYQLIDSVAAGVTFFVDSYSGHGNPNSFFYYVCAVNGTGGDACSVDQCGKFVKPLDEGWNLLSVPLIQSDWRVSIVLQTVKYDSVRFFERSAGNSSWREYSTIKPYGQDAQVNMSSGFWANVIENSNLTVAGKIPVTVEILLRSGWNLIGYPALSNTTLGEILSSIGWTDVEGFDEMSIPYRLRELDISYVVKPGEALWVHVPSDVTLTIHDLDGG